MPRQYSTVSYADLSMDHVDGLRSMADGGHVMIDPHTWRRWEMAGFQDHVLRIVRDTGVPGTGEATWYPNPVDPVVETESLEP